MTIGNKIRMIRELRHLSQEDIARKINLSQQAYGKIERDETRVDLYRLKEIAQALDVSVEFIQQFDERNIFLTQHSHDNSSIHTFNYHYQNQQLIDLLERTIDALRDEIVFLREQINKRG